MDISQVLTKLKALIYSKSETDSLLGGKANSSHTHTKSQIIDFPAYGTTAGTICQGNDSRLSDARTPKSHTHTKSQITDFPSLATVATSGSYNDLSNKPTIPSNTNQLTNGAGFITSSGSCNYANYSGYVQGNRASGTYVNEVKYGSALVTTNQTGFGAIWNAPTKNYRVACAVYTNAGDVVYLCYSISNANVSSSTNSVARECTWNANDGTLTSAKVKATEGLYYNSYRIYVG